VFISGDGIDVTEVHKVCIRFHTAIELIGARWSGAVLRALFTGSHRFADVKAAIPDVSDTMLTQRLRDLEHAGLVVRRVVPSSPVRVEYELTESGRELEPVLDAVIAWSHKWIPLPSDVDDSDCHPAEVRA
jgi:DNA-binding HxlR family transcriptional regulator